jgi:hypothetical protein
MEQIASAMSHYAMYGQHTGDRAMTRYKYDIGKMVENNDIATGPGRYRLGVPNAYGNAAFVPDATIRMQKWGAAHDMSSTKTDVESDLWNISRPTTKSACGQYDPAQGAARHLTPMPETAFPRVYERLVDPPCTLRGTGWNRWEWLCQNPQDVALIPFENLVNTQQFQKDVYAPQIAKPLATSPAAYSHAALCGRVYLDPAVPVARAGVGPDATTNEIKGVAAKAPMGAVAREAVRPGLQPTGDASAAAAWDGVTTRKPMDWVDRERATTGRLAAPPPFTNFISSA